jgi:hypothetical protein
VLFEALTLLTLVAAPAIVAVGGDFDRLWSRDSSGMPAMFQLHSAGVLPRLNRVAAQPWLRTRWGASAAALPASARTWSAAAELQQTHRRDAAQPRLRHGFVE